MSTHTGLSESTVLCVKHSHGRGVPNSITRWVSFIHVSYLEREIVTQDVSTIAGVNSLLCEGAAELQVIDLVLLHASPTSKQHQ